MSLSLVVMGATGHMGGTVIRLAHAQKLPVAAVLDRAEQMEQAATLGLPCGHDPATVLGQASGATVIDFTVPTATLAVLDSAIQHKNPLVIGTTGFTAEQKQLLENAARHIPVFFSPNMSVGVNALLDVLPRLVRVLGPDYDIEVMEMHHNRKKDAPSGTALRLAECLADARDWNLDEVKECSREGMIGARPKAQIGIQTLRGGDVVGMHTVYFAGEGERIEVTHHAHSRDNFARGALRAAQWLADKKPGKIYSMQDMLQDVLKDSATHPKDKA